MNLIFRFAGDINQVVDSIPVEQPYELMINPKTNKIYATYSGYSRLSIVNDDMKQESSEKYETIIGVLGAGALAGGIAFFIIRKKKKQLA